jgi:hypothetical protein
VGPLAAIGRAWRGELGVGRSTLLLSGLGAFILGSLGDAGMEAGVAMRGAGLILFALCALGMTGYAILAAVAVWRAARRHPGIGSGLAIAFAVIQSVLLLGDVGLSTLAAFGLASSPLSLLADLTAQATALAGGQP